MHAQQSLRTEFTEQPPLFLKWHVSPSGTHELPQLCPLGQFDATGSEQMPTPGCAGSGVQTTRPAPGMLPMTVGSPPQQSEFFWQRSPLTWQPDAGWQMCEPEPPNGAHSDEQQPVQPEHVVPSTEQVLEIAEHVPTLAPAAMVHTDVQQSAPLKQMSPTCVQ